MTEYKCPSEIALERRINIDERIAHEDELYYLSDALMKEFMK